MLEEHDYIDPSNVSMKSAALRYGGIGGILLVLLGLVTHLTGMVDYQAQAQGESNWLVNILNYIVWIGAIVMGIKYHRDQELGGFISFGRAFSTGMLTALIMGIIGAIWTYVFFSFIAPDVIDMMKEVALEQMSGDEADAAAGMMDTIMSPGVFAGSMIMMSLIGGAIVSAISAAIMKRESRA